MMNGSIFSLHISCCTYGTIMITNISNWDKINSMYYKSNGPYNCYYVNTFQSNLVFSCLMSSQVLHGPLWVQKVALHNYSNSNQNHILAFSDR